MRLNNDEGKLNFIVSTQYSIAHPEKGASIVLNRLAYEIAKKGHNVYVFNKPYFPHENIKVIPTRLADENNLVQSKFIWDLFTFPLNKTISIYNQVAFGNPYNTIHNVRWVLHDFSQEQWNNFGKDDVIYNFGDFKVPENTKQSQLTVFDYKLDKFKNLNNSYRKGFCSLRQDGKTRTTPENSEEFLKTFTSDDISDWYNKGGYDYLLETLNKYEYLITFEDKTYLTTIAALCGTKSIILNNKNYSSPIDFRIKNPIQLFGVAYGLDDIGWANKTINLVRENIINLEKRDLMTVDNFVKYWEKKIL
jgi:hypothetical protein